MSGPAGVPTLTAAEILRKELGGSRNLMTPELVGQFLLPDGAVELSRGTGLDRETIFGVSVVRLAGDGTTSRDFTAGRVFWSMGAASQYIRFLQGRDA